MPRPQGRDIRARLCYGFARTAVNRPGPEVGIALRLNEILVIEACLVTDERLTRDALLRRMVVRLGVRDPEGTLDDIRRREETMSTAFGMGVAIPHCFRPAVGPPRLAIAAVPVGVDFHAPDGEPTRVVFLLVEDITGRAGHVAILSHIATLCRSTPILDRLVEATGAEEMPGILEECERDAG